MTNWVSPETIPDALDAETVGTQFSKKMLQNNCDFSYY
jgi:hypothetical protein